MKVDTVIFDLGNVLAFHDNARLFEELGALFRTTSEKFRARVEATLWKRVNTGLLPGDALRQELAAALDAGHVTPEAFERAWSCHFTLNAPMVRHAERLVGKARLVLLSNTHDLHYAHLRARLPVLEKFDAIILSNEVGLMKPDPEIYRRALGNTPAERAVFFDDVPEYVEGARAVGLHAHVFTSAEQVPAQLAALGLPHLLDVH